MSSNPDFIMEDGVLVKYIGSDENVEIPEEIHEIASRAFFGCVSVVRTKISERVTAIGDEAFR